VDHRSAPSSASRGARDAEVEVKVTKQGVRDMNQSTTCRSARAALVLRVLPAGATCDHRRMRVCCYVVAWQGPRKGMRVPCGHLVCPTCGLFWDESAETS
jgi:hypothetical protein